jgi:hypothetical protein
MNDDKKNKADSGSGSTKPTSPPFQGEANSERMTGFDLESLKLSQDFSNLLSVKKNIHGIQIRKPGKNEFFRIRSEPDWSIDTAVLEVKKEMDTTTYVVAPSLWKPLMDDITPQRIFTAINTQGVVFLVPVTLPKPDGTTSMWHETRLAAVEEAKTDWVKLVSNKAAGAYETFVAKGNLPEPTWPNTTFQELFNIAFEGHYIDSLDHPVLQRRRGEIL